MRKTLLLIAFVLGGISCTYGWGATGHRVVGEIAFEYLSPKAKKKVMSVLKGQSLAIAGTWMDDIRSDRKYDFMADWHWVTVPDGMGYQETEKNPKGDIVTTIERMIKELKSRTRSGTEEEEAVKILIHLIADIHQPLHVGTGLDRGGNETKVRWMGANSNLHRVWDSDIIDETKLSYTEFARSITRPSKSESVRIQKSSPLEWAEESKLLRKRVYDIGGGDLGFEYSYNNIETVKRRLLFAGIRLAAALNEIYK